MKRTLVDIRNADVYLGGSKVLSSINWSMKQDENWAVVGNNGAGKTTFMKLVFGEIIPAYGGAVHWFGHTDLAPLSDIREKIGFVSAEYQENYLPGISGWEVVASGFFSSIGLYDKVSSKQKKTALDWMKFLEIGNLEKCLFGKMSYGEARRVLLARALVSRPALLILDEPCTGLDIPTREHFLKTLEKLSAIRIRVIYVTHHIEEIMPLITHVLFLKNGKVFSQGKKDEMLKGPVLSRALDCRLTLEKNSGRYWLTGSRPKRQRWPK